MLIGGTLTQLAGVARHAVRVRSAGRARAVPRRSRRAAVPDRSDADAAAAERACSRARRRSSSASCRAATSRAGRSRRARSSRELRRGFRGPVLFGLPSGHTTAPTLTLPFGVRARVVTGAAPGAHHRGSGGRALDDEADSSDRHLRDARWRRWPRCSRARGLRRARLRPERLPADERLSRGSRASRRSRATAPSTSPRELDLVVVGNAISRGNAELEEVLDRKIRYCSLPEAIRDHFLWGARSVVIAGTHGKTTTTSLTGWLLTHGGADPSVLIGGIAENFDEQLPHRRRARVRDRGGRVRQRVLRQDREVPEVPARHRRRQQHRVRPRRHLSGPRRDPAGVPAVRQPRPAARPAAARRRQRRRAGADGARALPRRDVRARRPGPTGRRTI